jgi:hypothetical protein
MGLWSYVALQGQVPKIVNKLRAARKIEPAAEHHGGIGAVAAVAMYLICRLLCSAISC